jgi:hypothetical protein
MAFNIDAATVRRFELPLDEKIGVIAVLLIRKVNLEIFAARAGDRNVWKRKLFHPCTDITAVRGEQQIKASTGIGSFGKHYGVYGE